MMFQVMIFPSAKVQKRLYFEMQMICNLPIIYSGYWPDAISSKKVLQTAQPGKPGQWLRGKVGKTGLKR